MGVVTLVIRYSLPFFTVFIAHYISTNLYASLCAHLSLFGFLRSLVVSGSPVCGALLHIMNYSHIGYGAIVVGFGTAMLHQMTKITHVHCSQMPKHTG